MMQQFADRSDPSPGGRCFRLVRLPVRLSDCRQGQIEEISDICASEGLRHDNSIQAPTDASPC